MNTGPDQNKTVQNIMNIHFPIRMNVNHITIE